MRFMGVRLRHVVGIADVASDQLKIRIVTKCFIDLRADPSKGGMKGVKILLSL